jgi:serine/threonine protein kinase
MLEWRKEKLAPVTTTQEMDQPQPNLPLPLQSCEYKTGRTLGQGSFGTVKEAVKITTGEKFAVKMISKKLMRGREYMIFNEIVRI